MTLPGLLQVLHYVRWLMFSDSIECAKTAAAFYVDVFDLESVVLVRSKRDPPLITYIYTLPNTQMNHVIITFGCQSALLVSTPF